MTQVAMLLSNPFRPDPRVLKEANSLAERGCSVDILAWDRSAGYPNQEEIREGIRVSRIQEVPSAYGIGAGQILKLPRFWLAALQRLNRLRPDIIHCHDFDTLPAGLAWGWMHRKPVIYDAHEYYADLCKPRLYGWSGKLLYHAIRIAEHLGARLSSAVITVDETLADIYRKLNKKVEVIGHYPYSSLTDHQARVFKDKTVRLLYAGRLSVDRGLLYYADLLRALTIKGVDARLVLAGIFMPATEETLFWERVGDLRDAVEFLGWIPYAGIAEVLEEADIGLAVFMPDPRYVAGRPVKLFEYMAVGLPVISSNFPPIASVIGAEQAGLLIDPLASVEPAVNAILEWVDNPAIPKGMGARARQAVLERYNWENLMDRLMKLYQQSSESGS